MKRLALAIVAAAALLAFGWASPAMAHNSLVEAQPAKEAVLTEAPAEVRLRFLATLGSDTKLTVTDAQGASAIGPVTIDGKIISAPFAGTTSGVYTVGYSLTSSDGHPIKSTYAFTLRLPEPSPSLSPSPSPAASTAAATPVPRKQETPWFPYIGGSILAGLLVGGLIALLNAVRARSNARRDRP